MTSLASQLQKLQTSAARHLTVEKRHVSLLFDKPEAGKISNETAFRIGVAGLEQMKRIDPVFDTELVNDLFVEEKINFVRNMIEKEENEILNTKIEKLLFELSPYLQHFACQQVLEYLVHTFQIYSFNAEFLILTFLPFHETKIYARILKILDFDWSRSKEWQFMLTFLKSERPIPFTSIVKATMSSSHSIVTRITEHINKGIEIVGSDYLEVKHPILFNFQAKLLLSLFNDPEKVDEMMLSKLLPFIENGITSPLPSFRYCAFMLVSQLVLTVKLKEEVLNSLCKLLLTKMKPGTAYTSIATLMVVFQQQNIESFSKNTLKKLLKTSDDLAVWKNLKELSKKTDTTKFFSVLWKELFGVIAGEKEEAEIAKNVLIDTTSDSSLFTSSLASVFLNLVFEQGVAEVFIESKEFNENLHAISIKFAKEFDNVHSEFTNSNKKMLKKILKSYDLQNIVQFVHEAVINEAVAKSDDAEIEKPTDPKKPKLTAVEKAKKLAEESEFSKRKSFSGDPISSALKWIKANKWNEVEWALNEMSERGTTYFAKKLDEDIENFVVQIIKTFGVEKKGNIDLGLVKGLLVAIKLSPPFIYKLLNPVNEFTGSSPKKAKGPATVNIVEKEFGKEESVQNYNLRIIFVLECLNARKSIPFNSEVLKTLFNIIKDANARNDVESLTYQQNLAINSVRKIFEMPEKTKIGPNDVDIDCVIETMRSTPSHNLLRDCLRLIVAAARHAPNAVAKHVMAVFTFMGNGILRKDNELTLSTVEKTVESLFSTIISQSSTSEGAQKKNEKLIELAQLFAASATDIPAHRRARIAQAIARAVGAKNAATVVMVLVAGFCARWQRTTEATAAESAKRGSDQDAYDDLAIELLGALNPFEQLSSVLEIVEYVLRLGGDKPINPKKQSLQKSLDELIFNRALQTLPRIRHFRYVIVTLISRIFANRVLIEKLAAYDDEDLLKNALPLGKRLIECSVELDEFANKEANAHDSSDPQSQRYWVAFASRTEVVSEKLRHLLPGGVAARLIADILKECGSEKTLSYKMCEKVLQLANIKLGHDGYLFVDNGINEKELITLAKALNKFIVPENKNEDRIRLCQNAAYTLKLIAKHLNSQSESEVLANTMQKCVSIASQYQKLDDNLTGNVLLLAGELIRSHNMASTINHAISLLKTCLAIIQECIVKLSKSQFDSKSSPGSQASQGKGNRGQRIRQQSLGGLKFGSDTLLICSLTCVQRIFDQFASFVCEYSGDVIIRYCRLISRFGDPNEIQLNQPSSSNAIQNTGGSQTSGFGSKSGMHHRLSLIRRSLLTIEIRILPNHFSKAVQELKNDKKSLCALFNLLSGYIETQQDQKGGVLRKSIVQLRDGIVRDIITPALEFRYQQRQAEQFENVENLEMSVFNFIISMANVLSEVEFRPVVNQLVSWAELGLKNEAEYELRIRLAILLHFANSFYEAFNSLALPYFGRIIEIAPIVLKRCNATTTEPENLLITGKRGTIEALEANRSLVLAINLISNAARHKDFFTPDRCQLVADAIIDELVNTKVEGHEKRCSEHLITAIYRIGNADSDNFGELLNKMMLKTRDSRAKIRYRTLLVLELLIEKIGDGIQPHLSLLLPFLNELIEDENKQVEAQCQAVVKCLQHKFGESFWSKSDA